MIQIKMERGSMNTQETVPTSAENTEKELQDANNNQEMQEDMSLVQKDLAVCKEALADWQDKYTRMRADFENYKKRMIKEQASWMQSARVSIISDLLGIIDNFDRAMEHITTESGDMQSWIDGISMIHASFKDFLKKAGVQEVPYNVFDPQYHEALLQVDSDNHEPGQIVTVLEKGYMLQDQVIRPAKVSVAK
jgi:molecular chaperone GrpE